jgi:predicted regulator of Ras-like GTPase activity (Roadblock/LC7/MglB family)
VTDTTPKSGLTELAELLAKMTEEGGFPFAVLTDQDGLAIAAATASDQNPETSSAVVARVQKTVAQVRGQLGMAATDEISVYDADGRRLVCRPFNVNGHELILAVLVPVEHKSYRRLTTRTLNAIRRIWKL